MLHRQKLLVKVGILTAKPTAQRISSSTDETSPGPNKKAVQPQQIEKQQQKYSKDDVLEKHAATISASTTSSTSKAKKPTKSKKSKQSKGDGTGADAVDVVKPFEMWSDEEDDDNVEDGDDDSDSDSDDDEEADR